MSVDYVTERRPLSRNGDSAAGELGVTAAIEAEGDRRLATHLLRDDQPKQQDRVRLVQHDRRRCATGMNELQQDRRR